MPNGDAALKKAIGSAASTINKNGALFIHDFAGPLITGQVVITPKNKLADSFTEDFFKSFAKKFDKISEIKTEIIPTQTNSFSGIKINSTLAAELIVHFKNYLNDVRSGILPKSLSDWLEIEEIYFVPNPNRINKKIYRAMTPEEYLEFVLNTAKEACPAWNFSIAHKRVIPNKKTSGICAENFASDNDQLLSQITSKFEIILKRE